MSAPDDIAAMADTTVAAETTVAPTPEPKAPPPEQTRDELLLKFVGTATLIVGIVLLVSATIAISTLSILKFDIAPWLPVLPLSLLLILVGGLVNGYYRRVIDRLLHPKRAEELRPPYGFVYPYQMPSPIAYPRMPPPMPAPAAYVPAPQSPPATRFCIMCGRRIPVESRFCPYCRHAFTA